MRALPYSLAGESPLCYLFAFFLFLKFLSDRSSEVEIPIVGFHICLAYRTSTEISDGVVTIWASLCFTRRFSLTGLDLVVSVLSGTHLTNEI